MVRKPKKKVARKKVVSQPRKAGSRPVWALLLFFIALCSFVAIWDFEIAQSRQHTTELEMNLVGVFGAEASFWAFHFIGVATWLIPLYLLWAGVRFILQQQPRRRMVSGFATVGSLICASGLAAMMEAIGTVKMQGGIFEQQLSQGVGGVFGEFLAAVILQPFIGPFGSFLILLMGFVVGSVIVFTDNLGRFLDYIQNAYSSFLAERAGSKEERKALRAERGEAKRLARAQHKADRAAAKASKKSQPALVEDDEDEEDAADDDGRRPSLLPASITSPAGLKREVAKKKSPAKQVKLVKPLMEEPEPPVEPPKPKFDPSMIKVVAEEKTEKAVASIPERRGDYVFPPLSLLLSHKLRALLAKKTTPARCKRWCARSRSLALKSFPVRFTQGLSLLATR